MEQELSSTAVAACAEAGGANGTGVGSRCPERLQSMRLEVVDVGGGNNTIEIRVRGHLKTTLHDGSGSSRWLATGDQSSATMAESRGAAEARKYLNDMRGWLMTVAALFVGLSFQAMSQRPKWMPEPEQGLPGFLGNKKHHDHNTAGDDEDAIEGLAERVVAYVLLNTITFSTSLVLVLLLLLPNVSSPTVTLRTVRTMMMLLAIIVAVDFSFMISRDTRIMKSVLAVMALYALITLVFAVSSSDVGLVASRLKGCRSRLAARFRTRRARSNSNLGNLVAP